MENSKTHGNMFSERLWHAAHEYRRAGISFLPISCDGKKQPALQLLPRSWSHHHGQERPGWNILRERFPTDAEIDHWYSQSFGVAPGIAIISGSISGNLEIVDFDNPSFFDPWMKKICNSYPAIIDQLVIVQSPRPGFHVYYRTEGKFKNQKLAKYLDPEKQEPRTAIETRGEGGFIVAPPSPGYCHSTGREYSCISNRKLAQIATITLAERMCLIEEAMKLSTYTPPQVSQFPAPKPRNHSHRAASNRPGDLYAATHSWAEILCPYGWRLVSEAPDGEQHWCRPGKAEGTSATIYYANRDIFHVFSENAAPFEAGKSYDKFGAYALLNHGGSFRVAARHLKMQQSCSNYNSVRIK